MASKRCLDLPPCVFPNCGEYQCKHRAGGCSQHCCESHCAKLRAKRIKLGIAELDHGPGPTVGHMPESALVVDSMRTDGDCLDDEDEDVIIDSTTTIIDKTVHCMKLFPEQWTLLFEVPGGALLVMKDPNHCSDLVRLSGFIVTACRTQLTGGMSSFGRSGSIAIHGYCVTVCRTTDFFYCSCHASAHKSAITELLQAAAGPAIPVKAEELKAAVAEVQHTTCTHTAIAMRVIPDLRAQRHTYSHHSVPTAFVLPMGRHRREQAVSVSLADDSAAWNRVIVTVSARFIWTCSNGCRGPHCVHVRCAAQALEVDLEYAEQLTAEDAEELDEVIDGSSVQLLQRPAYVDPDFKSPDSFPTDLIPRPPDCKCALSAACVCDWVCAACGHAMTTIQSHEVRILSQSQFTKFRPRCTIC